MAKDFSYFFQDPVFLILLTLTIITLIIFIPAYLRRRKIISIESSLPEVLNELAEGLRTGISLEASLKEIADKRKDIIGKELKIMLADMKNFSFAESMKRMSERINSRVLRRVSSIINISIEANASLSDVLQRIAEEIWSAYIIRIDRETKTQGSRMMILFGGSLFAPAIGGVIIGVFGGEKLLEDLKLPLEDLTFKLKIFNGVLAFCSVLMYGIISGKLKEFLVITPLFIFLSYLSFMLFL